MVPFSTKIGPFLVPVLKKIGPFLVHLMDFFLVGPKLDTLYYQYQPQYKLTLCLVLQLLLVPACTDVVSLVVTVTSAGPVCAILADDADSAAAGAVNKWMFSRDNALWLKVVDATPLVDMKLMQGELSSVPSLAMLRTSDEMLIHTQSCMGETWDTGQ